MTDDTLEVLLTPRAADANVLQKQAILQATLTHLPRPRRWVPPLAGALVFAAGLAAGWFLKPPELPERIDHFIEVPVPVAAPVSPPPPDVPAYEAKPDSQLTASELDKLETAAEIADAEAAAKLYRRVADEYLARSDVKSAVRCYRLHLNEAGRAGLTRTPDDSWLLVSLKNSTLEDDR